MTVLGEAGLIASPLTYPVEREAPATIVESTCLHRFGRFLRRQLIRALMDLLIWCGIAAFFTREVWKPRLDGLLSWLAGDRERVEVLTLPQACAFFRPANLTCCQAVYDFKCYDRLNSSALRSCAPLLGSGELWASCFSSTSLSVGCPCLLIVLLIFSCRPLF